MRIEDMQYFLEVSQMGSISRAAKKLFITQQGLSRVISALEDEFNVDLFIRDRGSLILTDAGKCLEESAKEILKQYGLLRMNMVQQANDLSFLESKLHLYATQYTLSYFNAIMDIGPKIIQIENFLRVTERTSDKILDYLDITGPNDLVFFPLTKQRIESGELLERNLVFYPFFSLFQTLIVGPNSPLKNKPSITTEEIAKQPLAFINMPYWYYAFAKCLENYGNLNIVLDTSDIDLIIETVKKGNAVSFSTTFDVTFIDPYRTVDSVKIEDAFLYYVGFIFNKAVDPSPAAKSFIRYFIKHYDKFCDYYAKVYPYLNRDFDPEPWPHFPDNGLDQSLYTR